MFLTPLARMRLAGRLCRVGSWLIAVAGLAASICVFFLTYNPGPDPSDPHPLLISLAISVLIIILVFFFFVFLFAVGTLLEYVGTINVSARQRPPEASDEYVEITPLP